MTAVTTENDGAGVTTTGAGERPSRAAARRVARAEMPGYKAAAELAESGALDGLFAQIDAGEIDLTGDGGACQVFCVRRPISLLCVGLTGGG